MKGALLAALLASFVLAGCAGDGGGEPGDGGEAPPLDRDKGAITGLLLDDAFRPIPDGLLLLQPVGLTATSDGNGEFSFSDLDPGAYTLRVQSEGHEAAPLGVDVVAGEYTEIEVSARRVFSEAGRIITTEYSVFISCAADFIANGIVFDCTLDQSGDSDRADFNSNYTGYANATYLVTEMRANKESRYEVQVRCSDEDADYSYYAVARINGDYAKMTMPLGRDTPDAPVPPEYTEASGSGPWMNDCEEMQTILFTDSQFREELQSTPAGPVVCCGLGAQFGIKARFVQSLFIGEPEVDIATYSVLG